MMTVLFSIKLTAQRKSYMGGSVHGSDSPTEESFMQQYTTTVLKHPPKLCQYGVVFTHWCIHA